MGGHKDERRRGRGRERTAKAKEKEKLVGQGTGRTRSLWFTSLVPHTCSTPSRVTEEKVGVERDKKQNIVK